MRALIDVVCQWFEQVTGDRQPPLPCLLCDTVFGLPDRKPELFIASLPYANPTGGIVSGVCGRCARDGIAREDASADAPDLAAAAHHRT